MTNETPGPMTGPNAPIGSEPSASSEGGSCPSCGASLAAGQRYCVNCGSTTPHCPATVMAPKSSAAAAAGAATPARTGSNTPGIAAAGVCLSLLFLATGVLVGRNSATGNGSSKAPAAQAPIVIQGGAAATGSSAQADTATGSTATDQGSSSSKKASPSSSSAPSAPVAGLSGKTGADYAKASANLPNQIKGTGTKLKKDNKAPGGGSGGGTTIG